MEKFFLSPFTLRKLKQTKKLRLGNTFSPNQNSYRKSISQTKKVFLRKFTKKNKTKKLKNYASGSFSPNPDSYRKIRSRP
jgi:hypothetical protein